MESNRPGTITIESGQLPDSTIAFRAAADMSMAGATPSLCDAGFYVPELLAYAARREGPLAR